MPPKELSKIRINFNLPEKKNLNGAESYEEEGLF